MKFIYRLRTYYELEVSGVVVDRNCGASDFCRKEKISCIEHSFKRSHEENQKLVKVICSYDPDIVITNVHRILSEAILVDVPAQFINLHYSYLPAYTGLIGMKPIELAMKRKNLFAGVTCHNVTAQVDKGDTLAQSFFPLSKNKQANIQKTFEAGALTLLAGLMKTSGFVNEELNFKDIRVRPGLNDFYEDEISKCFLDLTSGRI